MWWIAAQKTGVSASNFKDFMGFGSYESAWAWLHKLRRVMVRPDRDKLKGEVEVDETYIGGKEKGHGKQGRGADTKTLVVVATECIGKQIGRVRFRCSGQRYGALYACSESVRLRLYHLHGRDGRRRGKRHGHDLATGLSRQRSAGDHLCAGIDLDERGHERGLYLRRELP